MKTLPGQCNGSPWPGNKKSRRSLAPAAEFLNFQVVGNDLALGFRAQAIIGINRDLCRQRHSLVTISVQAPVKIAIVKASNNFINLASLTCAKRFILAPVTLRANPSEPGGSPKRDPDNAHQCQRELHRTHHPFVITATRPATAVPAPFILPWNTKGQTKAS
jgi:hypothetical protein